MASHDAKARQAREIEKPGRPGLLPAAQVRSKLACRRTGRKSAKSELFLVGRRMADVNPIANRTNWHHPDPDLVRLIYGVGMMLTAGHAISLTGIDSIGGVGFTSRCADRRGIDRSCMIAKAYPDGRLQILNQPRWDFPMGLANAFGDDLATNDYSTADNEDDDEGQEHAGTKVDCTVGNSIPHSFSQTQLHLSTEAQDEMWKILMDSSDKPPNDIANFYKPWNKGGMIAFLAPVLQSGVEHSAKQKAQSQILQQSPKSKARSFQPMAPSPVAAAETSSSHQQPRNAVSCPVSTPIAGSARVELDAMPKAGKPTVLRPAPWIRNDGTTDFANIDYKAQPGRRPPSKGPPGLEPMAQLVSDVVDPEATVGTPPPVAQPTVMPPPPPPKHRANSRTRRHPCPYILYR